MRRTAKATAFGVLMVIGLLVQAHELWMQPAKFHFAVGENLVVNIKAGENLVGKPWPLEKERLAKLEHHRANAVEDLTDTAVEGEKDHLTVQLNEEGSHLVVLQTHTTFIELEAGEFNASLKEDGLDEAYTQREKTNALDKRGKELYARYSKLFVQAGKKTDNLFKKAVGLPLEIMPEQNPTQLKAGSRVSFKVLFKGKPEFGARVKVWNHYNNRTTMQPVFSQQDGRIEALISSPGMWMVSVVKMIPSKDPKADWESFRATLVFGVQ